MTAAWEQPGRTDGPAYDAAASGQSLADEQRLEAKARELASEAFDKGDDQARMWLRDAAAYEYSIEAGIACEMVLFAAIAAAISIESSADLSFAVERLRECYVDARNEDYDADAAESLAEADADCAADFEDAGVGS